MNTRLASRLAGCLVLAGWMLVVAAPARADQASEFAQAVFDATNAVRLQYGLFPLAPDARLAGTALAHSQLMASNYLEAHQIPPERDPGGRLTAAGYHWNYERENLAEWPIASSAADLVQIWLTADPAHRDNILATNVWDMGIGVVIGEFDPQHPDALEYWVTQDMGREGDANFNVHLGKFQIAPLQLTVNAAPNTPASGSFTITNVGDSYSRLVGVVSLDNTADFTLSPAGYNLRPGVSQVVTVTFLAKGAAAGHATISSNDPARATASVSLTGNLTVAAPAVQVNPASLTISTPQGTPATSTFTVDNAGDAGTTLTGSVSVSGSGFSEDPNTANFSLGPNQSQTVSIRFDGAVSSNGTATVTSNDPARGSVSVTLKGTAVPPASKNPKIQVAPGSLTFNKSPQTLTFQISNAGDAGSTLTGSVAVSGGGYAVDSATANFNLAAGQGQTVRITFQTPAAGSTPFNGTAAVTSNDAVKGTVSVGLTARPGGPIARVHVAPLQLSFTSRASKPQTRTFRVSNVGTAGSVLSVSVQVAGTGFSIVGSSANLNVIPGHPKTVKVTYQPPAGVLSSTGTATVTTSDPNQSLVPIHLSGVRK